MRLLADRLTADDERFLSTHSKRSATNIFANAMIRQKFLSTHSKRSATTYSRGSKRLAAISIHALQTECDISRPLSKLRIVYFYPRTPNGVRLMGEFSTPTNLGISIHALQTECDHSAKSNRICDSDFYPRTPNGVRHRCFLRSASVQAISIHALQTEGDHNFL